MKVHETQTSCIFFRKKPKVINLFTQFLSFFNVCVFGSKANKNRMMKNEYKINLKFSIENNIGERNKGVNEKERMADVEKNEWIKN